MRYGRCVAGVVGAGALFCLPVGVFADASETMTKIVIRNVGGNVDPASFEAKPVTHWRMGTRYGRVQEEPDPNMGIHGLIVVNEPDVWMANLYTKTARHIVDSGPTYVYRVPLLSTRDFPGFLLFELGKEFEFIEAHAVEKNGTEMVDGQSCDRYELAKDGVLVVFHAKEGTRTPFQLEINQGDRQLRKVRYEVYETGLPPDLSLFEAPQGMSIEELRP